jgi:DNA-directed RNA polymerase subunit RPC12/RpoP
MQGRTNFGADTLLGCDLHRFEGDAATLRARRRIGRWVGSDRDDATRRAQPASAAHTILAPHDLIGWPKTLDNVPPGFHGSRCRTCQRPLPPALAAIQVRRSAPRSPAWIGTRHRKTTLGGKPTWPCWSVWGRDAWLRCDACARSVMVKPRDFAERHGLDMLTPLLTISRRMRCTRCGARKGGSRPAPHDTRAGLGKENAQ